MAAICNANSRAQTPFVGKGRAYGVSDGVIRQAMVGSRGKTENRNRYRDILKNRYRNRYRLLKKTDQKTKTDTDPALDGRQHTIGRLWEIGNGDTLRVGYIVSGKNG